MDPSKSDVRAGQFPFKSEVAKYRLKPQAAFASKRQTHAGVTTLV